MKYLVLLLLLTGSAFAQEESLIAILKSDAPVREKADACRELARFGTRQAVPILASLLANEELSHMARYALEPIADPSVDAVLRDALGTLRGQTLAGVVVSLGVRKDSGAIEPRAKLLTGEDASVAQAAARALGSIGGAAAAPLQRALSAGSAGLQLAACEGLFRCAEAMPLKDAMAIYDTVGRVTNLPSQVRIAAFRGGIRSRGAAGVPLLIEAIRSESPVPAAAALRISADLPGAELTKALAGELAQATPENQLGLIQTLGYRRDATAAPALLPMAQTGSPKGRVAAIRSLVQLGDPSALPVLVALVKDAEASVASAAQNGLLAFPGSEADAAVVASLHASDAKTRVAMTEAVTHRRIAAAVPVLIEATGDADAEVASASFRALGELAGVADIPRLVNAMLQTKAVAAAETALSAICARQTDPTSGTEKLVAGLARAQVEPKIALLRVLGTVGGPAALSAVRAAAADSDQTVKEAALRVLCDWPTVAALPDLAQIARTSAASKFKILALRGQLRLIPLQTSGDAPKLAQIKELLPSIENAEEKRLVLSTLGDIPSAESLALVLPYVASEELKEEANVALVGIAEKIFSSHPTEAAEALKRVQTNNNELAARVRKLQERQR